MARTLRHRSTWDLIRALEGAVLGGVVLYAAKPVLVPLALAILLSFVLYPIVVVLQRLGLNRIFAVLVTACLAFAVLSVAAWTTAVQLQSLAAELPQHKKEIRAKFDRLRVMSSGPLSEVLDMFRELDQIAPTSAEEPATDAHVMVAPRARESSLAQASAAVLPVLEPLATAGVVVILVLFLLINREDLRDRMFGLIGHGRLASTTRVLGDAAQRLSHYLLAQLFVNAAFGFLLAVIVWAVGVPFALLWGLLATVLRFIPYVGTWIAASPPILLSVALFPGWWQSVVLLAGFLVIDLLTANAVEPLLFGHNTGVTPIALLVAACFWTWIWGPVGLILSTPLTVCLVVLGQHVPRFKFLMVLLGGRPAFAAHIRYYQRLLAGDKLEARQWAAQYVHDHGVEKMFDHVVVPALRLARRDRRRQLLAPAEEEFVYQATDEILDSLVADLGRKAACPQPGIGTHAKANEAHSPAAGGNAPAAASDRLAAASDRLAEVGVMPCISVLGCPAHHVSEELLLKMLHWVLRSSGLNMHAVSNKSLPSEIISWVEVNTPAVVFIAVLPPGGLPQAGYLCEQLRQSFPDLRIVVGYWGPEQRFDSVLVRLRAAGASYVTTSLFQSRNQVEYLAQVAP